MKSVCTLRVLLHLFETLLLCLQGMLCLILDCFNHKCTKHTHTIRPLTPSSHTHSRLLLFPFSLPAPPRSSSLFSALPLLPRPSPPLPFRYITLLVELTKFESTRHGKLIASQMLDVTIRVKDVRPFSVKQMATILDNMNVLVLSTTKGGVCEVLYAAAWIVGEFSE